MWLTEEEQEEVRDLLRESASTNNRIQYARKEMAFWHRLKDKYGEKTASAVLAKMWKTEGQRQK